MRVIAGEARGRHLKPARGEEVRPMTDRVRSAVFSSLGQISGATILDLYSGSGSIGIEALSRGAKHATFVEKDPAAVSTIQENLELTGLARRGNVVGSAVESFLARGAAESADLVFVDPPFKLGLPSGVLSALVREGFVDGKSVVVVQVSSRNKAIDVPEPYEVVNERRYGDSRVLYLKVST